MQTLTPWAEPKKPAPALARRLERQVLAPARSIGEDLSLVGVTKPLPPVWIRHQPDDTTWIAARPDADPVAEARGGLHTPPKEIKRLARLHTAGVRPEVIRIGHQLPGHWEPGDPVPPAYLPDEQAAIRRILNMQSIALEVARGLFGAVAGLGASIGSGASVGAAGLGALMLLDPLVLGGVIDRRSGLVAWTILGAWDESAG
ncbi:MAG: hypothetical protein ACTHKT_14505 [Solirubrobacterales bacterium]